MHRPDPPDPSGGADDDGSPSQQEGGRRKGIEDDPGQKDHGRQGAAESHWQAAIGEAPRAARHARRPRKRQDDRDQETDLQEALTTTDGDIDTKEASSPPDRWSEAR